MSVIGKPRPCGCKGYRTCLICEKEFDLPPFDESQFTPEALEKNVCEEGRKMCVNMKITSVVSNDRKFPAMYIVRGAI
jgi:hypothetical protein